LIYLQLNCTLGVINNTQMVFTCKEGFYYNEIPFDQFANSNLTQITSFSARGYNGARGPMISIPNNICSLPNLQVRKTNKSPF